MQAQLTELEADYGIEWQDYRLDDLFEIGTVKSLDEGKLILVKHKNQADLIPFVGRTKANNGIKGYVQKQLFDPNPEKVISISQIGTLSVQLRTEKWYASQNIFCLNPIEPYKPLFSCFGVTSITKSLESYFSEGYSNYPTLEKLNKMKIKLPTIRQNGEVQIAFDFMEAFIATLKAERLATLKAYLTVTGLTDTTLTASEETALARLNSLTWKTFRILDLFGKSSRGRRLKSADRIEGKLPFVTAGEANAGISAWIGNDVHIFSKNTVTIDMFGSAKYRGYDYGADDHVAVVHSEKWLPYAVLFLTACIHKSSHAGQFDYSRNFYASDADDLTIQLPITKEGTPDYDTMSLVVSALQKVVIQGVVSYLDDRIEKTGELV
jgi:hypothetical protein